MNILTQIITYYDMICLILKFPFDITKNINTSLFYLSFDFTIFPNISIYKITLICGVQFFLR